ncbi:MAG: hypothetical protein LBN21_11515 [Treponema sp.]|jgi:hypothetical protein|nr:hypothetical protein [Treponema sp.]
MAIQPIDLQALFSQVDKVGKTQSDLKDALAVQQAMQGVQMQKKTEANIQSVNKTQDSGEGVEKVNDRDAKQRREDNGEGKAEGEGEEDGEPAALKKFVVFRDPALGKNIDISG